MKQLIPALCCIFLTHQSIGQNQTPVIHNLTVDTDIPNSAATLQYDLSDMEGDPLEVIVQFSTDGGKTYITLTGANVAGDVGFPVATGNRSAVCTGLDFTLPGQYTFRVVADDKQPFDLQALVDEVDSIRMENDLLFVQGIRHRTTGLEHLNETRDSFQNLLKSAGLYFENQSFPFSNTMGQNLIGTLPGTSAADKVVIVDAHYDSDIDAPGADDNGSGTVGVMEIARLLSRYPSQKTQRYIGFDLEEAGLLGSIRYVTSGIPATEQVEGVFNFEMIGFWSNEPNSQTLPTGFSLLFPQQAQEVANNQYRGDFITNVGNTNSQSLATLYSNAAQQYAPALKLITLTVPGNGAQVPDLRRSDHAPFWDSGRKALMLTDGANFRNDCYHESCDTLENRLNFTFMADVVKATLASMAQLVEIQHADWATVSFETAVGTAEPNQCGFHIWREGGLILQANACFSGDITLELYDLKGTLVAWQAILLPESGNIQLSVGDLPSGMYFARIRHSTGTVSQKIRIL